MIGLNYRLLGYVFEQRQIRGAVWILVRRGVQDALYGLSDALKVTVMGKVGTLRRVSWEWVSGSWGECHGRIFFEKFKKIFIDL